MTDPEPMELLTYVEALNAIKVSDGLDDDDELLLKQMVAAALPILEDQVGPIELRDETIVLDGGRTAILLPWRPFRVTAVVEYGSLLGTDQYVVVEDAGLIYRGTRNAPRAWREGSQMVQVTAEVGNGVIGPNIKFAAMELIRHWWQVGRQGPGMDGQGMGEFVVPQGFLLPNRVVQLCKPAVENAMPGFA